MLNDFLSVSLFQLNERSIRRAVPDRTKARKGNL